MDELFTVRTFLDSVTPVVIVQLMAVFTNKVTGITSQVSSTGQSQSSMLLLLASVSMSGGGMALRQSLLDKIIFSRKSDASSRLWKIFLAEGFGATVCFTKPDLVRDDNINFPFLMSDSLVR